MKNVLSSSRNLIPGVNDLATTNSMLVEEWDYDANYPLTPLSCHGQIQ